MSSNSAIYVAINSATKLSQGGQTRHGPLGGHLLFSQSRDLDAF